MFACRLPTCLRSNETLNVHCGCDQSDQSPHGSWHHSNENADAKWDRENYIKIAICFAWFSKICGVSQGRRYATIIASTLLTNLVSHSASPVEMIFKGLSIVRQVYIYIWPHGDATWMCKLSPAMRLSHILSQKRSFFLSCFSLLTFKGCTFGTDIWSERL